MRRWQSDCLLKSMKRSLPGSEPKVHRAMCRWLAYVLPYLWPLVFPVGIASFSLYHVPYPMTSWIANLHLSH